MNRVLLIIGLVLVSAAILLQFLPRPDHAGPSRGEHLASTFPHELPGWKVQDRELGQTEAVRAAADKQLKLNDYIYRTYEKGRLTFDLYVAYWAPGRMPVQMVASHTPDRCWTENGWTCTDMQFAVPVRQGGFDLKPAQQRSFELEGTARNVLYWHLVEGEPYDYGSRFNNTPDPRRWIAGFWNGLWEGQPEQYFIRLSSTLSFQELWREPVFLEVVDGLVKLGLQQETLALSGRNLEAKR